MTKNRILWIDRGAVRISSLAAWNRFSAGRKGKPPKYPVPPEGQDAGSSENIRRTVTEMWSAIILGSGVCPVAVNVGLSPGFTVFCFLSRKEEKT